MTPLTRSRRLQAGLAGLSVLTALGAAVGLGLTTHTHSATRSGNDGSSGGTRAASRGDDGDNGSGGDDGAAARSHTRSSSPVTPPTSSVPQATTSGS
jgi:hypothetical protein